MKRLLPLILLALPLYLSACGELSKDNDIITPGDEAYPQADIDRKRQRLGKLTGDEGLLSIGGAGDDEGTGGNNPLGVNSFLWRATIDTLAFLPMTSPDPFGGVITTDWYEDPEARGERYKVNALILDRRLAASSLKITVFRQQRDAKTQQWEDAAVDPSMARKLEDTVLTRARQMRVKQLGY